MHTRLLIVVASLAVSATSAQAADSGVFCNGSMLFIERVEPSGLMSFKVLGSNIQKNIIELSGTASPRGGGWRYQIKSDNEPDDRCTLDIRKKSGGYSIQTVDGARCVNSGGNNAWKVLVRADFSTSSRVFGVEPIGKDGDDFAAYDCDRHKFNAAISTPTVSPMAMRPPLASAAPQPPVAVVRELIERDHDAQLGVKLPDKPDDYMRHHFTAAFNGSWANAMSHNKEEPVLDGDFITGFQTVTHVTLKSLANTENGDFAFVSTNIVYLDDQGPYRPHTVTVRFFLKRELGLWKIDDINSGDQESIRSNFKKSYGK